jgi:hypothetical protein
MLLGGACFIAFLCLAASSQMHLGPYAAFPLVGFVAIGIYMNFFIRCPRCHHPLGRNGVTTFAIWPTNFCPGCGVNLDDQADETRPTKSSKIE